VLLEFTDYLLFFSLYYRHFNTPFPEEKSLFPYDILFAICAMLAHK
jgi:hypothetical protein